MGGMSHGNPRIVVSARVVRKGHNRRNETKRERQEKNAVDPFDEIIKNLENIDRNVRELADNIKEQPAEPKGK